MTEHELHIRADVLAAIRLLRLRPTQLIDSMRGYTYVEIQEAICNMTHLGSIVLSSDRYLEIPIAYEVENERPQE